MLAPNLAGVTFFMLPRIPHTSCVDEFEYWGKHFVGCTAVDHDTPWCSMSDPYSGAWAHCHYKCPSDSEEADKINEEVEKDNTLCSWESRPECAKPFVYKGTSYSGLQAVVHRKDRISSNYEPA